MLKYFVAGTEQTMQVMILCGFVLAYIRSMIGVRGKKHTFFSITAGLVLALVMVLMKTLTSKVDTSLWNLRIYIVCIAAFILFTIFNAFFEKKQGFLGLLAYIMLDISLAMSLLYYMPIFFENAYTIGLTEGTVLSTGFLLKIIGALLGWLFTILIGVAVFHGMLAFSKKENYIFMMIASLINILFFAGKICQILLGKRYVAQNHIMFVISKFVVNHAVVFTYLMMALAIVVPVILIIRSTRANEPYSNNAERRKIIAKWRSRKRWSVTIAVTLVFSVLTLTVINTYANRVIELSPIEDTDYDNENVYVPVSMVSDGHLHRFGYTTESGVTIRFIVIKKTNSSSFGIGLDACDICGETGYYEKDGQVVCNKCDVVMNINTIGFKGGCNPIIIDYTYDGDMITVPIAGLVEHEKEFK